MLNPLTSALFPEQLAIRNHYFSRGRGGENGPVAFLTPGPLLFADVLTNGDEPGTRMIADIVRWLEPYPFLYRPARSVYRTTCSASETWRRRRERAIARKFHQVYHHGHLTQSGLRYQWLGVPIQKLPSDLCILQEILWEPRPEQIIECELWTDPGR
jgi:hypothetical protein